MTIFDLVARPDAIAPPWVFLAIFWVAGVVLLVVAIVAWRQRWGRWRRIHITLFATAWWCIVVYASWAEMGFAWTARAAVRSGNFESVGGCLSSFHPGKSYESRTTDADEVWTVKGKRFEYGAGDVGFAWNRVEPLGGSVHADSLVDVSFVRDESEGRNKILRLAVTPHACPPAPDPGWP